MGKGLLLELDDTYKRVFVVGDIHGCLSELETLLMFLDALNLNNEDLLIFVGDYVDRGEHSKGVIDLMINLKANSNANVIFLMGNHEQMLLNAIEGGKHRDLMLYLANGGQATVRSYGIKGDISALKIKKALPDDHLKFFQELNRYLIIGDYVVAHAGLNPLRDLKAQLDEDLFWIREEFLLNMHYFKKTVIFGHTPFQEIFFDLPYKIGIDTGLVFGNKLTCIEIKNNIIYQVIKGKDFVDISSFQEKLPY